MQAQPPDKTVIVIFNRITIVRILPVLFGNAVGCLFEKFDG